MLEKTSVINEAKKYLKYEFKVVNTYKRSLIHNNFTYIFYLKYLYH